MVSPATLNIMENITITIPAELADDIKRQIENYEAKKPKQFWRCGDEYAFITERGLIETKTWSGIGIDLERHRFNNVYPVGEAQAVADQMWAKAKIARYIAENSIENGFVYGDLNWGAKYDYPLSHISLACLSCSDYGGLFYVRTCKIAQQIIDAVGADTVELAIRGRVG